MASITNLHEQGITAAVKRSVTLILFEPHACNKFPSVMLTVGLQKIFSLLESEDPNVRIHAVKVVANLAAEGA